MASIVPTNFASPLSGTEQIRAFGVSGNGQPSGEDFYLTTQQIANLGNVSGQQTVITALNTVGAGTITAANMFGKITSRGGTQTAVFTDTTDTATNIIAALGANAAVGQSYKYVYENNTTWPATITGGTNVTVSGASTIPANGWAEALVTYVSATSVTVVFYELGYFPTVGTFTANGTTAVTIANTSVTANSQIGMTLKSLNSGTPAQAPYIATITPGTGFTIKAGAGDTCIYNYQIEG